MIPTRQQILSSLPAFKDEWIVLKDEQGVEDIVKEIERSHKLSAGYYDKIALYFGDGSVDEICERLYKFCKKYIAYSEEPEETQTSKLPSAMLIEGHGDCKHYSSFCAGVLDALRRQGNKINWCYRFASYKILDKSPHHVFVVVNDKGREIWIDPTPGSETRTPVWILDKKFYCPMALIRNIAGVGEDNQILSQLPFYLNGQWYIREADGVIGSFDLSSLADIGQDQAGTALSIATGDIPGIISSGTSLINSISQVFGSLFGGSKECNAYATLVSLFPVANPSDAQSVMSALNGLYNHYKVEKWVVDRSVTATRCWPEAYEQYFKELIAKYNSLVGAQVLTWSKNPATERNGIQSINVDQTQATKANVSPTGATTSTSGGFFNWIKANPVLAAGGAVGIFFLAKTFLSRKHKTTGVNGAKSPVIPLLVVAALVFLVTRKKTTTTPKLTTTVVTENPVVESQQQFTSEQPVSDSSDSSHPLAVSTPLLSVRTVDATAYEKPQLQVINDLVMMPPVYYGGAEIDYANQSSISPLAV